MAGMLDTMDIGDVDKRSFPFKGWLTISVLVALGALFLIATKPQAAQSHNTTRDQQDRQQNISTVEQYLRAGHGAGPLHDPVARRQAHHIKVHIARCAAHHIVETTPLQTITGADDASALNMEPVETMRAASQTACADAMLDQVLNEGQAARVLAQAIKASGVELGPEYEGVADTWPPEMNDARMARILLKTTGF